MGILLRLPFCPNRVFCLPILFRLYISKQTVAKKGGTYHSRPDLAVQMLQVLCNRFGGLRFHALADSTYGGQNVLSRLPGNCDLTSRLHLDARLHEPLTPRRKDQRGRAIGRMMGLHRETVQRYLQADMFPERAGRPYARKTDSVRDFLQRRWQEGCHNAGQLTRELLATGRVISY